jgi:hypothetical protein
MVWHSAGMVSATPEVKGVAGFGITDSISCPSLQLFSVVFS